MTPCRQNRKNLALLAIDELESGRSNHLRAHLSVCPGCRAYLEEISNVTHRLRVPEKPPSILASGAFHRELVLRVKAQSRSSIWRMAADVVESISPNWRFLVPAGAALALLLFILSGPSRGPAPTPVNPSPSFALAKPGAPENAAPTLASYLIAANRSLDNLDALLTKEGEHRNPSPSPVYTASIFVNRNIQN